MWDELSKVPVGLWGFLGTGFGAVVVYFGQKRLKDVDDKRTTTRDYRGEISELVTRLDRIESEVTFWRRRFYEEQENNAKLRITLIENGIAPPLPLVIPPSEAGGRDVFTVLPPTPPAA